MLLRLLATTLIWLILFTSKAHATTDYAFDLAEATLQQRLLDIAAQSGWQLNAASITEHSVLPPLQGDFTLSEILTDVLQGSRYQFTLALTEQRIFVTLSKQTPTDDFERIIVTGVSGKSRNILNSSISITQLSSSKLEQQTPYSSAEVLKNVTGFWVEDSGGETNNNVSPRGLRGGEGFRFISLMEDGLPITYDGIWGDFFLRPDLTHQTIEAVRGGSSGIFTLNGPAAMVNYITRQGSAIPFNLIKLSHGISYDYTRFDGVFTGPLTDELFYTIGGFYRTSDGIREPGYKADKGGQLSAKISWLTDSFEFDFSYKHLNDKTSFYAPLILENKQKIQQLDSLAYDDGTLLSDDLKLLAFRTPEGPLVHDLGDAQHTQMNSYTLVFKAPLSDKVNITNRTRYAKLNNELYTLMNLGNQTIVDAQSRLQQQDITDFKHSFADKDLTAQYRRVSDHKLIDDPSRLNENGLVTSSFPLHSHYKQQQLINHFRINYLDDHWSLSLGHIYARSDFSSLPLDQWLGELLTDVKHQPDRLEIVLINNQGEVVGNFNEQGFLSYAGPVYLKGVGLSESHSFYANFDWQITDSLRFDLALRNENLNLDSTLFEGAISPTDSLKPYYSHYLAPSSLHDTFNQTAFSVGANYQIQQHLAVFARYSDAFEMPRLINFGNARGWASNNIERDQQNFGKPIRLTLGEIGLRLQTSHWQFSGALFDTNFDPLPFTVYRGATGPQKAILINTQTQGLEFEFSYQYNASWQFKGVGVWQDAGFYGIPSSLPQSEFNGNQITRTPELQFRLTPEYKSDNFQAAITWAYIGERYSDTANQFALPAYQTWDFFSEFTMNEQLSLQLEIKNLTNTLGLTEGNPRDDLNHQDPLFYGRPIFGRNIKVALSYQF
ncbi:TonB-dependent receptor [Pseudoalteromonas sp. CF6-2]|uniref:TonB-dependent receptor n=1 Tax=Pseudoalteromonas sp. CF6-2 TaxID=562716 RepID=UPI001F467645|nr:TonB-dependent receptor [Pseudoalteromonas sp. CF6-2]